MKNGIPYFKNYVKRYLLVAVAFYTHTVLAQSPEELIFNNSSVLSGSPLANGAKYVFPNVKTGVDAVVTILGRSSLAVVLNTMDNTATGFDKAWQPQYTIGSAIAANSNWYIDFNISFYQPGNYTTSGEMYIQDFAATGLDIDGFGNTLREYFEIDGFSAYETSTPTVLVPTQLAILPVNPLSGLVEYKYNFLGSDISYTGIDTTQLSIMAGLTFNYKKSINIRFGGVTGSTGIASAQRLNSIWFKKFTLNNLLPLHIISFTGNTNANNGVELKWRLSDNVNTKKIIIEKSVDGVNFNTAGTVDVNNTLNNSGNYNFIDKLLNSTALKFVYYRLKQVDMDGQVAYSQIIVIKTGKTLQHSIKLPVYPDPVKDIVHIDIPNAWQHKRVTYDLIDIHGRLIKRNEFENCGATIQVNMTHIIAGIYIINANCNGETLQTKISKL